MIHAPLSGANDNLPLALASLSWTKVETVPDCFFVVHCLVALVVHSLSWFGAAVAKTRQSLRTVKSRAQLIFRNCSEQSKNQRRRVPPLFFDRQKKKTDTLLHLNLRRSGLWQLALASLGWTKVETVPRTVSLSQLFQLLPFVVRIPFDPQKRKQTPFWVSVFFGGEEGIRTLVPFGQTVFKTASL